MLQKKDPGIFTKLRKSAFLISITKCREQKPALRKSAPMKEGETNVQQVTN